MVFVHIYISVDWRHYPSGRKRFNVLAALNAVSNEITMVTNETYINAESVCQLLAEIAKLGLVTPITLVLDNARYQKCALVHNYAAALNIELLYLPSYSPHLNLIERLWKFVRKECLYSEYYEKFPEFKQAIDNCIRNAHNEHKDELKTLLSWKEHNKRDARSDALKAATHYLHAYFLHFVDAIREWVIRSISRSSQVIAPSRKSPDPTSSA
jgi:transposase